MKPVLLVIAGPNGSGKTTVTSRLRSDHWSEGVEYLNPDEIARDRFGDWNSPSAVIDAARWAEARREALLSDRKGIAFETVLSMPDKLEFVERARAAGYFVRSFFVGTDDPAKNAARILRRYLAGGHAVPIDKIADRYLRSIQNLRALVESSDRAYVFDNSVEDADARLYARFVEGQLRKTYGSPPEWIARNCLSLPKATDFEHLVDAP